MKLKSLLISISVTAFLVAGNAVAGTVTGHVKAKREKFQENVVVFIDEIKGEFESPDSSAVMNQKNLVFIPHVLPVLAGTTVEFLNSDDVLHNVFTPDKCAGKFNLGSWPKGEKKSYTFSQPGCTSVMLCNVHPEMEAFVLVLQNPYYAVTGKDGAFIIEDIPAGTHMLRVWSEKLKADAQEITVPAEGSVEAAFTLDH